MNRRFLKRKKRTMSAEEQATLRTEISKLDESITTLQSSNTSQEIIDSLLTQKKKLEFKLEGTVNKYNAVRTAYNNEWYDSKMEADFARALDASGVVWERQVVYELIPEFRLIYEKVKALTIRVDFLINYRIIVDVKGMVQPDWEIRWKVLKSIHRDNYVYFIVKKKSEFDGVIKFAKLNTETRIDMGQVIADVVTDKAGNDDDTHDYHQDDFESDHEVEDNTNTDTDIDF